MTRLHLFDPHPDFSRPPQRNPTRRPARILGLTAIALSLLVNGCRSEGLWSGAAFTGDGTLSVVAEEPVCGCMRLSNLTNGRVLLRSELSGATIGAAALNPRETRRFRFDWAGTETEDDYTIYAMDDTGGLLDMDDVVALEAQPVDCDAEECIYDTLLLNRAVTGQ